MKYVPKKIGLLLSPTDSPNTGPTGTGTGKIISPVSIPTTTPAVDQIFQTKPDPSTIFQSVLNPVADLISDVSNRYYGTVTDSTTGQAVPGATVTLFSQGVPIAAMAADGSGNFGFQTSGAADTIQITSASYQPMTWPASTYQHSFELEPDIITLDPVTASGGKKQDNSWLILLALVPLMAKKKAAVRGSIGKFDTGTVITVGIAAIGLIGLDVVKKMLQGLGIWDSQHTKNLDAAGTNPGSPWSPSFWQSGPQGTLLLRTDVMTDMLNTIQSAWGWISDDTDEVIGVFKTLKTQSQLSFFADFVSQVWSNTDLLTYLRGGTWPNDHLSDAEVDQINTYILSLPQYVP